MYPLNKRKVIPSGSSETLIGKENRQNSLDQISNLRWKSKQSKLKKINMKVEVNYRQIP